jgi:putative CocE/NonD family hydrolase
MTVVSSVLARLAKLPPAGTKHVAVERDLVAKMPDGIELLADRWYPTNPGAGTPPIVLLRSPYGRRLLGVMGRLFAERGYQTVIQSCRATFGSSGEWVPFRNEQADGHATLEWIAGQPWFDGQLVTFGASYLGITQWAVAEDAPEYLKAMALNVTTSAIRAAIIHPGESFALESLLCWVQQVDKQEGRLFDVVRGLRRQPGQVAAASMVLPLNQADRAIMGKTDLFLQDMLSHETPGDPWWDAVDFGRRLDKVPAASLVGGWYDLFLPAQVADYEALVAGGRTARLTVGPWTHASPGSASEALRDGLALFNEQVKAIPSHRAPVRLFVMGSKRWQDFQQWPPPADAQPWYLGRGGTLGPVVPEDGPPDAYRYDPADPTPGIGGAGLLAKNAGPKDQQPRESRADVLTYTSAVMTSDLTVIGPLTATLHLRSTLEHTDFFVRLCDVSAKGKSTNLSDGIVRLSPGSVTSEADGTFRLAISMWPTANTFRVGHRVRLQVSSGAHPLYARNLGSGEPLSTGTTLCVADQEVWHDHEHQSFVTLPVVAGG